MSTGQDAPGRTDAADVVVIGAGPTGLACAAALSRCGLGAVVLEQGDDVGTAWRGRYRALRLNSGRAFSGLPGARFPRGTPTFPARDEVVRYLEDYRARHGIDVRPGTRVTRLDRDDGHWRLATSRGALDAPHVVVATGLLAAPFLPPALAATDPGPPVVHSAHYVDAVPYRGSDVLVVGAGSSAMEIAHDLARGGAGRVLLSVRTPPNILPRSLGGLPGDPGILLMLRLPPRMADAQLRLLRRMTIGDLRAHGLPTPKDGPFTRLRQGPDPGPAVVDPEVIDDIRTGRIEVVAAVAGVTDGGVRLTDGTIVPVDAVVAATGFRPGLEPLVGHLGVLDPLGIPRSFDDRAALPGLRFVNFRMRPDLLGAAGGRARRTAAAIARETSGRGG